MTVLGVKLWEETPHSKSVGCMHCNVDYDGNSRVLTGSDDTTAKVDKLEVIKIKYMLDKNKHPIKTVQLNLIFFIKMFISNKVANKRLQKLRPKKLICFSGSPPHFQLPPYQTNFH